MARTSAAAQTLVGNLPLCSEPSVKPRGSSGQGKNERHSEGDVNVWRLSTDGACATNPGPGGWAAHLLRPDGMEELISGSAEVATSNRMEVVAVIEGLKRVPEGEVVEVQTDSANVIGWLARGWRRNNAALRPLLDEADVLTSRRRVRFVKVRGHAGDPRNELVNARAEREARGVRQVRARGVA